MLERKLTAYYCDYCNKRLLSKFYMIRHERHCTLNPSRSCRLCGINGEKLLKDAMALLPKIPDINLDPPSFEGSKAIEDGIKLAMPAMAEILDYCPACMLAAMRISGATKYRLYSEYKDDLSEWFKLKHEDHMAMMGN